ncbi:MAG TPA: DUF2399 domain-containing protein [Thermoanaerobaculia bacterium]|jgi:hypothetical protein
MNGEAHVCRWRERLVWSGWSRLGALEERLARRISACEICGRTRRVRVIRPAVLREARAAVPESPPLAGTAGRMIAAALVRQGAGREIVPIKGMLVDLARRGIPASLAEEWVERFLRAGWLTAVWRLGNSPPRLASAYLEQPAALREMAKPGEEDRRRAALREARERVSSLSHPKAVEISALLAGPEAGDLPAPLLQALAALAAHAESGEVLAERVFSARHLGGSKALVTLRGRLERLAGPLAEIGIREGASVTLLGGDGALRAAAGEIGLRAFAPFLGLAREAVENLREIDFPAGGLFAVENLAVFEACCRGEVAAARGALIAWSAGYPGRAFRRLVELAGRAGAPLRIWADLDLDGVRIARLIASWSAAEASFHRMSAEDLETAPRHRELTARSLAAIRRDLEERPAAPLADTLQAMLAAGRWVEQEAFLR